MSDMRQRSLCAVLIAATVIAALVSNSAAQPSPQALTLTVAKPRRGPLDYFIGNGLFDVNTVTGAARSLGAFPGLSPAWSTASTLAYASQGRIWVASSDARSRRVVTPPHVRAWGPSWSPNGKQVAFACELERPKPSVEGVCLVTLATGAIRRLTKGGFISAVRWSPNGIHMVHTERPDRFVEIVKAWIDNRHR